MIKNGLLWSIFTLKPERRLRSSYGQWFDATYPFEEETPYAAMFYLTPQKTQ